MFQLLPTSFIASEFYNEIYNHHKYPISSKVEDSTVIGKPKNASESDRLFIARSLNLANDVKIDIYDSVLLHKIYYETCNRHKRTLDSFILNTKTKKFAEIKSIFVAQNKLYFLVNEKFEKIQDQMPMHKQ